MTCQGSLAGNLPNTAFAKRRQARLKNWVRIMRRFRVKSTSRLTRPFATPEKF